MNQKYITISKYSVTFLLVTNPNPYAIAICKQYESESWQMANVVTTKYLAGLCSCYFVTMENESV